MQTYKQHSFGGGPQGLTGLSRAMALPHEYPPTRFPSFPALERTAVMAFNRNATMSVEASDTLPATRALLMRQATYPLWYDQKVAYLTTMLYSHDTAIEAPLLAKSYSEFNYTEPFSLLTDGVCQVTTGTNNPQGAATCVISHVGNTNTVQTSVYGSDGSDTAWLYAAQGMELQVTIFGQLSAGTRVRLYFDRYDHDGTHQQFMLEDTVSTKLVLYKIPGINILGGFYRLRRSVIEAPLADDGIPTTLTRVVFICSFGTSFTVAPVEPDVNGNCTVVCTSGPAETMLMPVKLPPEFQISQIPWQSTRLTAVAALFTNVTKILNKEGTVTAARLNPRTNEIYQFTADTLQQVHPSEKFYDGLEHGAYSYCPPSTDLAEFYDYTMYIRFNQNDNSPPLKQVVPCVRLDNTALVNCFSFADPDGGTALAINLDLHIEFRSTSVLWPIGMSSVTLETLHQAQLALVQVGFFFRNDNHKSVLQRILSGIATFAKKATPYANAALHGGANGGVPGAIAGVGNLMLSNMNKKVIQPTSAVGSGMVKTPQRKASGIKKKVKVKLGKKK